MKIYCWECGEQISHTAPMCPKCGALQTARASAQEAPVAGGGVLKVKNTKPRQKFVLFLFVVTLVTMCVLGVQFLMSIVDLPALFDLIELLENAEGSIADAAAVTVAMDFIIIGGLFILFAVQVLCFIFVLQARNREASPDSRHKFAKAVFALIIASMSLLVALIIVSIVSYSAALYVAGGALTEAGEEITAMFLQNLIVYAGAIGIFVPTLIKSLRLCAQLNWQSAQTPVSAETTEIASPEV